MKQVTDRFRRLSDVFEAAIERTGTARSEFLDRACGDDATLRQEVEEMILAHEDEGSLPGVPSVLIPDLAPDPSAGSTEPPFEQIGPYRLTALIGEGGMGVVWRAEQDAPVKRSVALKLIKPGLDSREVLTRFESERQALAVLDHPGIARVIDGGLTPDSRPYFVMELVEGLPITNFCREQQLSLDATLELFASVCRAVQHAHLKGIVHRDLKPSNILVVETAEGIAPKIIDFGVAKATQQPLTEESLHTARGMLVGTPDYMSPEQAEPGQADIDSRTDVYSLGVLLYELLVGVRPFPSLRRLGLVELLRVLREDEPQRPSTRLQHDRTQTNSHLEPSTLARELGRDLDWIVLKAMEKDRERRYATASELAADVRRYLDHEPLEAGPPSVRYRLRKFVRRHRSGVAAAAVMAAAVLVVAAVTSVQSVRLAQALDRSERDRVTATRVSDFMIDLFEVADVGEDASNRLTARQVLDRGVERIDRDLADEPRIRTSLLEVMGKVYNNLALFDQGRELFEKSSVLNRDLYGESSAELGRSLSWLAGTKSRVGQLDAAREDLERALEILRESDQATPRDLALPLWQLGSLHLVRGEYEPAETLLREALEKHSIEGLHKDQILIRSNLGSLQARLGNLDAADATFTECIQQIEQHFPNFTRGFAGLRLNLAYVKMARGEVAAAEAVLLAELERLEATYGELHETIAHLHVNLAVARTRLDQHDLAEQSFSAALATYRAVKGASHPDTLRAGNNYALALVFREANARAIPLLEEVIEATNDTDVPAMRLLRARALQLRGLVATEANTLQRGEDWLRQAVVLREATQPQSEDDLARYRLLLGNNLRAQGRYDEAENLLLPAYERLSSSGRSEFDPLPMMIDLYDQWGRVEEAARFRELLKAEQADGS